MNIVILDGQVANPGDLSWDKIEDLGNLIIYNSSTPYQIIERAANADIIITNKCKLGKEVLLQLPNLKCICLLATGYDNIDVQTASSLGVTVCNAQGYSAPSVAQHTLALILALTNQVGKHNKGIHEGDWFKKNVWSYWELPIVELAGKTIGIYGMGNIGSQVATIAHSFGMKIITIDGRNIKSNLPTIEAVSPDELFRKSDIISLHVPYSDETHHLINSVTLQLMKSSSFLINTGRGDLVNEADLRKALDEKVIAGAALDVLSSEPPPKNHILIGAPNCIITPHQAWASKESRSRLLDIVADNIAHFLQGIPTNVVT